MLQCQDRKSKEVWQKNFQNMHQNLEKTDTDPHIHEAIMSQLDTWQHQQETEDTSHWDASVQACVAEQDEIGWKQFMERVPLEAWAKVQQQYCNYSYKTQRTGRS